MSWPVDLSRTACSILVGNCRCAVLRGVMTLPVMSVDAGQYCLLCDGVYLGFAVSIARWAIAGCGHGFEDAKIGYSLRSTKLFKQSGGRFIGQDGSMFLFIICHCRKKRIWLGRWWAGG